MILKIPNPACSDAWPLPDGRLAAVFEVTRIHQDPQISRKCPGQSRRFYILDVSWWNLKIICHISQIQIGQRFPPETNPDVAIFSGNRAVCHWSFPWRYSIGKSSNQISTNPFVACELWWLMANLTRDAACLWDCGSWTRLAPPRSHREVDPKSRQRHGNFLYRNKWRLALEVIPCRIPTTVTGTIIVPIGCRHKTLSHFISMTICAHLYTYTS
jgi:hypothetical protein